jgi:hypothetical protein
MASRLTSSSHAPLLLSVASDILLGWWVTRLLCSALSLGRVFQVAWVTPLDILITDVRRCTRRDWIPAL